MNLDTTPLNFGMYKGVTPEVIADSDPSYIVWLYENILNPRLCSRGLYLSCVDVVEEAEEGDEDE